MIQEINSLMEKRAIEIVPNSQISAGFYSTVFLVEKKTGGYRMVLNLKSLNKFIRTQHFKMETLRSVVHSLDIGDWVFSLDLSDAYLHIPIHPKSKQYLRFAVDGIVYQYCALPFGIASAPRMFTKIVSVILSHLRQRGIQVHAYLDDWLIRGKCPNNLSVSQTLTVETIQRLGFIINWEKSNLAVTQKIIYLGAFINLKSGQIFPTEDRCQKLRGLILKFQNSDFQTVHNFLKLLGLMNSCIDLVPWARLHMRPVQIHLLAFW